MQAEYSNKWHLQTANPGPPSSGASVQRSPAPGIFMVHFKEGSSWPPASMRCLSRIQACGTASLPFSLPSGWTPAKPQLRSHISEPAQRGLMRQVPDIRGGPAGPHHRHLLGHLGDLLLACPSIFPFYDSLCLSLTSCHPTSAPRAAEASSCALSWKGSLSPSLSLFLFVSLLPVTPPPIWPTAQSAP